MAHIRKTSSGGFEARYRGPDGREHAKRFPTRRTAQAFSTSSASTDRRGDGVILALVASG